jgi:hypothetical protein
MTASLADLTRRRIEREARLTDKGNDLTSCRCLNCGHYWATNAGPVEHFQWIMRLCPVCIALLPTQGPL